MRAEDFKAIQQHLALSNAAMAEQLGCCIGAVEKWRAGTRNISRRTAKTMELLLETKGIDMHKKVGELHLQRQRARARQKEATRVKQMIIDGELETRFFTDKKYLGAKARAMGWSIGRLERAIERLKKTDPGL